MFKRFIAFFMITIILLPNLFVFADELPESDIVGETAVLIDARDGKLVWGKDPHKKMYPASTTKMMTAIIILENHALDEIVEVPSKIDLPAGIAIDYGEIFTVEQLMYALLVKSANDAGTVLAVFHSGSIEKFSEEMNLKALEIGARDTHFTNPHGLHDTDHYSTAYDMALIGKYGLNIPEFKKMVNTSSYIIPPTNKKDEARNYIKTSNKFLRGTETITYNGQIIRIRDERIDGIKTGYTVEAGNCLVSSAQENNQRYISVVMYSNGDNSLYKDSLTILDYGFQNFSRHQFVSEGSFIKTIQLDGDKKITVNLIAGASFVQLLDKNIDITQVQQEIMIDRSIPTPIRINQKLGEITYYHNKQKIGSVPLLSEYEVTESNLVTSLESAFLKLDDDNNIDIGFYVGVLFKLLISFILYRTIMTTINLRKRKNKLLESQVTLETEELS